MAINNKPIFIGNPAVAIRQITNNASTFSIFPGGGASTPYGNPTASTEGWYVEKVRVKLFSTSGSTTTSTATVLRFYISPDSGVTNYQFDELNLPATSISPTVSSPNYEIPLNIAIPSGYSITVKYDTTPGLSPISTWITTFGGAYAAQ